MTFPPSPILVWNPELASPCQPPSASVRTLYTCEPQSCTPVCSLDRSHVVVERILVGLPAILVLIGTRSPYFTCGNACRAALSVSVYALPPCATASPAAPTPIAISPAAATCFAISAAITPLAPPASGTAGTEPARPFSESAPLCSIL